MLKVSARGRYGLRCMIELARSDDGKPLRTTVIAERQQISKKYLRSIFYSLSLAQLVTTRRGRNGGFLLLKDPSETTALEIVEALEGELVLAECLNNNLHCKFSEHCEAQKLWRKLNFVVVDYLGNITLKELAK